MRWFDWEEVYRGILCQASGSVPRSLLGVFCVFPWPLFDVRAVAYAQKGRLARLSFTSSVHGGFVPASGVATM